MMTGAQLAERLQQAGPRLQAHLRREVDRAGRAIVDRAQLHVTGDRLSVRTGMLRRSIGYTVEGAAGDDVITLRARAGSGRSLRYANILERGGTIVPRRGRFLAIPVGPALTPAGVARYDSPRQVQGLRFVPILGGRMALLVKDRRGRSEVWFRLVRRVTIRPSWYLRDAVQTEAAELRARLSTALETALEGV